MLEKKDFSRETLLKCLKRLKLNGLNAVLNQVLDEAKGSRLTPTETLAYALGAKSILFRGGVQIFRGNLS